jgi:lysophospholipase L1-like esterase
LLVLVALCAACVGEHGTEEEEPMTEAMTILVVGDSISAGTLAVLGGWRYKMEIVAGADGFAYTWVGTNADRNVVGFEYMLHEAWSGERADQLEARVAAWSFLQPTDVIVSAGTNDLIQGADAATTQARVVALVNTLAAKYPLANIIWTGICHGNYAGAGLIPTVNAALPAQAQTMRLAGRRVSFWAGLSLLTDPGMADSTHPNDAGYVTAKTELLRVVRSVRHVAP